MASDDGNSLLEIPGAWISTELDLDLSLPVSLTAPSSVRSAYIRSPLNEPPIPLPRCDTLPPPSAPIVGRSTPRAAYLALEPHESDLGVERATVVMSVGPDAAADVTPQNTPPLSDGASDTSSTPLPSPVGVPSFPLPGETFSEDTTSIHSGVTKLSFCPSGSLLSGYDSDSGFPTAQEDLTYGGCTSHDSLNYSAIDVFPSSASMNLIPSIPSLESDLRLRNFPISDESSLERHSIYFSAVEGDFSVFRGSEDGPDPVHETSTSSRSALEPCILSADGENHHGPWQENPSPRRRTARIEVLSDVFQRDEQGMMRRETFTYACSSLPYDAGLRPHAYVDNHEHTVHGKHHLETLAEELYTMEEFMEEDHAIGESKRPTIFRKLVEGKRMSKLIAFNPLKFQKTPKRYSIRSYITEPESPVIVSSAASFVSRSPVTANYPNGSNRAPSLPPSPSPSSSPIPNKIRPRGLFRMTWPGPRPLSMFVAPKPKVEGKVIPSPRELPMHLPAGENPPISPHTSPQMRIAEIPPIDVHGRSYGPSRVASLELSSRDPDPPISGRKERRSWLPNIRSPKSNPLVV